NDVYLTNPTNNGYRLGLYLINGSINTTITNNNLVIDALGNGSGYRYGIWFNAAADQPGAYLNYNNYCGVNYTGRWNSGAYDTIENWIATTNQDIGSISANPLWANLNALDFHLQSTAGRWNPGTQAWVNDASNPSAIGTGDPAEDFSQEPANNGNRANIGSYGNSPEASKSVTALNIGRVRIEETSQTFNSLGEVLNNLANVKGPFTQSYTVTLSSGTYYEGAGSTATINTNGFQLTIQGDPAVSTTSVVFTARGHDDGIRQNFTAS